MFKTSTLNIIDTEMEILYTIFLETYFRQDLEYAEKCVSDDHHYHFQVHTIIKSLQAKQKHLDCLY